MKSYYQNKICLVTGAASGIGKAVSELLLALGTKVICADMNEEALQNIYSSHENAYPHKLNVTDYLAFQTLIEAVVTKHQKLDFLFNIAGITVAGEAIDLSIEHWRKVLSVDLDGVINGSTLAYKQMVKQSSGHIINLSSIQGLVPLPMEAPYVTAKYGVVGLSQALRVEGTDLGVRVSVVCPGYVKTSIFTESEMVSLDREKHLKSLEQYEKSGITSEGCAEAILKGAFKNKAIIPVTTPAKILWYLNRLAPNFLLTLLRKDLTKARLCR